MTISIDTVFSVNITVVDSSRTFIEVVTNGSIAGEAIITFTLVGTNSIYAMCILVTLIVAADTLVEVSTVTSVWIVIVTNFTRTGIRSEDILTDVQ